MKILIETTFNLKYIPKRKFLFWWVQISEFEFDSHKACINWLRNTYVPKNTKAKSATYFRMKEIYSFYPDYRDQIDKDFM